MPCDDRIKTWLARGRPKRTPPEMQAIFAEHCHGCDQRRGRKCQGKCLISAEPRASNLLYRANEVCPLGKWS